MQAMSNRKQGDNQVTSMTIEQARAQGLLPSGDARKQPENRKVTASDRASLEDAFIGAWLLIGHGLPLPKQQHQFARPRRWRFDFSWPDAMVAVELQGGSWINGRHTRGSYQSKEHEKLNAAQKAGWVVLQFGTDRMKDPHSVAAEVAEILRAKITQGTNPALKETP